MTDSDSPGQAAGPAEGTGRRPDPVDLARDQLAAAIEADFPGWTVTHDIYGWRATREGFDPVRSQSGAGLRALLPFWGV